MAAAAGQLEPDHVADGLISRESAEEDYGVTLPSAKAGD